MEPDQLRNNFEKNGWIIVSKVFSELEISQMRENVQKTIDGNYKGDLLSNPFLHNIVYDPRILNITKTILGNEVTYFGDSSVLLTSKTVGWHKDNPDRKNPKGPDWNGIYNVIRIGVYLEDHTNFSGGLLLRHKSHTNISTDYGRPLNVPVKIGDVAVWYLRTTHSGNARLLRFFPKLIINPKYYKVLPSFMFKPEKIDRMALAISYGAKGKHLDRFIEYLKSRYYGVAAWKNSIYKPEIIAEAEHNGLSVMDMRPEILDLDVTKLNHQHQDIPY